MSRRNLARDCRAALSAIAYSAWRTAPTAKYRTLFQSDIPGGANRRPAKERTMNRDQLKGRVTQARGKAKEAVGKAVGNERLRTEGQIEQMGGKGQAAAGDIKRKISRKIDRA